LIIATMPAGPEYDHDFGADLGPASIFGDAALVSGRVALTPEAPNTQGTLIIDSLGTVESFLASFDYRFTTGSSSPLSPGEGMSFFLAEVSDGQLIGEDGVPNGLSVSFDLIELDTDPPSTVIRLEVDGRVGGDQLFGLALAGVGDLDEDGVEEYAVGAPMADLGGLSAGAVTLRYSAGCGVSALHATLAGDAGRYPDRDGADDLLNVLAAWGECMVCPEDHNGDGRVDLDDVISVLESSSGALR
jgi:hypothetical protein